MIQKYKDFWKQYSPYNLHPKDADIISQFSGTDELVVDLSLHMLEEKYDDFKNGNNNIKFLKDINLNAIHSNMYCKSFIGNPETAKLVILYGNPGLDLGDYKDEHLDKEYIGVLNKELNFNSSGFLYLDESSKRTGGFDYWSNQGRFKRLIDGLSKKKLCSIEEAKEQLKNSLCLLQSIGYHSPKKPNIKPEDLPSSLITRELVHSYLLPKAKKGEIFIFSWRESNFWGLEEDTNVMIRDSNKAINGRFLRNPYDEAERILEFL